MSKHTSVLGNAENKRSQSEMIILTIILTVILIASLLGNLLVIICIRVNKRLREETGNIFLANLSITDITTAITVISSSILAVVADGWYFSRFLCDATCVLYHMLAIVSILTLCFISVDRFVASFYAVRYCIIVTRRRALLLICYAWFQGLCFGLAPSLLKWVDYDYWGMVCGIDWGRKDYGPTVYALNILIFSFIIPGTILAVAYCRMMKVATYIGKIRLSISISRGQMEKDVAIHSPKSEYSVGENDDAIDEKLDNISKKRKSSIKNIQKTNGPMKSTDLPVQSIAVHGCCAKSHEITNGLTERRSKESIKSTDLDALYDVVSDKHYDRVRGSSVNLPQYLLRRRYSTSTKAIRSLLVVVIAFFICLTPVFLTKMYKVLMKDRHALPGYVNEICTVLLYCSSAVNPLIYGICRKDFQQVYKTILSNLCKHKKIDRRGSRSTDIKS